MERITFAHVACSKINHIFLLTFLLLASMAGNNLFAQDTLDRNRPRMPVSGFLTFIGGEYVMADMQEINSHLGQYGYTQYDDHRIGLAASIIMITQNFYMGIDFSSYLRNEGVTQNQQTVRLKNSGFTASPGYLLWQGNQSFLFANFGVGADYFEVEIQDNAAIAFDTVLANPRQVTNLYGTTNWLLRPGLTGIFYLGKRDEGYKQSTSGFAIMAQAGYGISLGTTEWTLFDRRVVNGPTANLAGPFVKVGLAIGDISRRR